MIKLLGASATLVAVASLSGCSSQNVETSCKEYWKVTDVFLMEASQGDSGADIKYADSLRQLSKSAPTELQSTLVADSLDVRNSFESAEVCGTYLK